MTVQSLVFKSQILASVSKADEIRSYRERCERKMEERREMRREVREVREVRGDRPASNNGCVVFLSYAREKSLSLSSSWHSTPRYAYP
jgi:hypothetical protein